MERPHELPNLNGTANSQAVVKKSDTATGNNLLFAALLEHICAVYEPNLKKRHELFKGYCP